NGVNSTKAPTNPLSGGGSSQTNMNMCHAQCWYDQSIAVDPSDPNRNTVWIGGDLATAQSTDGGASWRLATWWLYSAYPSVPYAPADHHVAVEPPGREPPRGAAVGALRRREVAE